MPQLVVGTAGHIDHGKSRLVLALTGTDPDRLPEEQARGMTIDLGFAHARIDDGDIYFVDVPGHERFIRNMVAGATGIDVALLIVAADDSVMPQTREHAELLGLLAVERCIVVVTKTDLVDDDWAAQVEAEARELLEGVGIRPMAAVRTSVQTGRGLDELRIILANAAREQVTSRAPYRWFRMPIDRCFVARGRGTVVTGTVAHGELLADQDVQVWRVAMEKGAPGSTANASVGAASDGAGASGGDSSLDALAPIVRVRGLQSHHEQRAAAAGRMRLAVNLAGMAHEQIARGCELATPGYLTAARCMDVWLATLRLPGKVRRQRLRCRLHIATAEVLAQLRLFDDPTETAPYRGLGQVRTAVPIVAAWGDRFILRDESGMRTLGGGQVLRPISKPWSARRPPDTQGLLSLKESPPEARVEAALRGNLWESCTPAQLSARAGVADAQAAAAIRLKLVEAGRVVPIGGGAAEVYVHADLTDSAQRGVLERLRALLEKNPRSQGVPRGEWAAWMPRACPAELRSSLADWMIHRGHVVVADGHVLPRGHAAAMPAEDQALLDTMLREFHAGAFGPPSFESLNCRTQRNSRRLEELVTLAARRGQLVPIARGIWLHADRYREMIERVTAALRESGKLTVAEIRTLLNSSRKFVVPIVEHLDGAGITRRSGDFRILGPKAPRA